MTSRFPNMILEDPLTHGDLPNTDGALQLVVVWASGRTSVGRYVKTAAEVESALRGHAENAASQLTDGAAYSPDTSIEDNSHLEASLDELFDTGLLAELNRASSLTLATEDELRNKPLLCHAVIIGDGEDRAIFVKKRSPIQLAKKSVVAFLVNNNLDRVDSPIFAFDDRYDAIITKEKVYVLNKDAFEGLFKESQAVLAKTEEWVAEVVDAIPMTRGSAQALEITLKRNQFLRKKFLAVKQRPHVLSMTPDALREEIQRHGYDLVDLMDGDDLKVTEQNVKTVLQLLNEDLFSGGFSQERYAAGSKRPLS